MSYSLYIGRMYKPELTDIKDNSNVWQVESEFQKQLKDWGLFDKLLTKISGKYYVGVEFYEDFAFHGRYKDQYYKDYWNPEIRNPGTHLGWDFILRKDRLEEIMNNYVHENRKPWFKESIINNFIDGVTVVIRN